MFGKRRRRRPAWRVEAVDTDMESWRARAGVGWTRRIMSEIGGDAGAANLLVWTLPGGAGGIQEAPDRQKMNLEGSRRRWSDKNGGLEGSRSRGMDKTSGPEGSKKRWIGKNSGLEGSRRRWNDENSGLEGLGQGTSASRRHSNRRRWGPRKRLFHYF